MPKELSQAEPAPQGFAAPHKSTNLQHLGSCSGLSDILLSLYSAVTQWTHFILFLPPVQSQFPCLPHLFISFTCPQLSSPSSHCVSSPHSWQLSTFLWYQLREKIHSSLSVGTFTVPLKRMKTELILILKTKMTNTKFGTDKFHTWDFNESNDAALSPRDRLNQHKSQFLSLNRSLELTLTCLHIIKRIPRMYLSVPKQ